MKVGIFTFHDEYNYGSALQTYALQSYLLSLGYDVKVLHHHITAGDARIKGVLATCSLRAWFRFIVLGLVGGGQFARQIRLHKSRAFVERHFRLTKYRFYTWEDAPKDLGVDILIVGSDQLWSCQWECPKKYLLYNAPTIPAVAYAVSIGVHEIPMELREMYREGFKRFNSISVRERHAIDLMRLCGYDGDVRQTVDPTLLVDKSVWERFIRKNHSDEKHVPYIFCYFMGVDLESAIPELSRFATKHKCRVKIVVEKFYWNNSPLRLPVFANAVVNSLLCRHNCAQEGIDVLLSAGHEEFIRYIYGAESVLTDSFHALMFSMVFGKNVRVLRPQNEYRGKMFSRIEDACCQYMATNIICNNLGDAINSLEYGDQSCVKSDALSVAVNSSRQWLNSAIYNAQASLNGTGD